MKRLAIAFACLAMATVIPSAQAQKVTTVLEGLNNPCGVAIQARHRRGVRFRQRRRQGDPC